MPGRTSITGSAIKSNKHQNRAAATTPIDLSPAAISAKGSVRLAGFEAGSRDRTTLCLSRSVLGHPGLRWDDWAGWAGLPSTGDVRVRTRSAHRATPRGWEDSGRAGREETLLSANSASRPILQGAGQQQIRLAKLSELLIVQVDGVAEIPESRDAIGVPAVECSLSLLLRQQTHAAVTMQEVDGLRMAPIYVPVRFPEGIGNLHHDALQRTALGDDSELALADSVGVLGGDLQCGARRLRQHLQCWHRGAGEDLDVDGPGEARVVLGLGLPLVAEAGAVAGDVGGAGGRAAQMQREGQQERREEAEGIPGVHLGIRLVCCSGGKQGIPAAMIADSDGNSRTPPLRSAAM
jgi:hypothetical protein